MSAEPTGQEEEGYLEHDRKAFDEEVEWPFLESITLALMVSASLNHRPARMLQVPVQPLFSRHGNKCG